MLVGKDGVQGAWGLMRACWGVSWIMGLVLAHWWAELGPRVSGCRALGIPRLVPVYWYVGLCPGPSGGQRQVLGQLWAQGVLRQQACWWVRLCLYPASCLACSVSVLVLTGW